MSFEDGEQTGEICPECGKNLVYYMSFEDRSDSTNSHYTVNAPMIVCEDDKCDYQIDYAELMEG